MQVYEIKQNFIRTLSQNHDNPFNIGNILYEIYKNGTVKERYYIQTISVLDKEVVVCVPLHSNCKGKRYIKTPHPDQNAKRPGLDSQKCLFLTIEEFEAKRILSNVSKPVMNFLKGQEKQVEKMIENYLNDFFKAYHYFLNHKGGKFKDTYKRTLMYSSLWHFPKIRKHFYLSFCSAKKLTPKTIIRQNETSSF